ncbi:hypothetical protein [Methanimicrococcus blatticola]|uniref:Uncharacterized protein n=1 Tax=Methanimicrococcus blatticola TaxID=91560 RepID=A0A484F3C4_9EURY|nr:hypothetical protein [Methanimicrococcus blatticola]MBZ3935661.1 hypothetical protein [Methanimicrococcus blatticola]MCC2508218.1 hypothetical protein [Methanimicrococcus blatticola]TDQ68704.1 hypothetical protein C7391_0895 [Methanimicrococcus blatticola]
MEEPISNECIEKIWSKYNYKNSEFKEILNKYLGKKEIEEILIKHLKKVDYRYAEYLIKFKSGKIKSKTGLEIDLNKALENQLRSMRIFVAEETDERLRYRMEATLMHGIYYSKEPWSELADRGMSLNNVRFNNELPVLAINSYENKNIKIHGLFDE